MFNVSGTAYTASGGFPLRFGLFFGAMAICQLVDAVDEGAGWTLGEQLSVGGCSGSDHGCHGYAHSHGKYAHTSGARAFWQAAICWL